MPLHNEATFSDMCLSPSGLASTFVLGKLDKVEILYIFFLMLFLA